MTWKVTNEVGGDLLQASRKACLHSLSSFLTSNFLSNPLLPDLFYSADRLSLRSARPRHPDGDSRLKNWMEEAEELPWTGAPAGRSPGISCPPGASRLPPGLGCSRLKSSVGQDRGHATPVPSSSKITSSRHWLPRVSLSSYVNHSPHQPAIVTIAMHNSSLFLMLQIMPQLMA
eukprot:XP_028352194.1 uncharacterized protein LOC114487239 isoform X3 [Physeter catodon]